MLTQIKHYLEGTVDFAAIGKSIPDFLNLCAAKQFPIWNIEEKDGILYASTSIRAYKRMAKEVRRENHRPPLSPSQEATSHNTFSASSSIPWWERLEQDTSIQTAAPTAKKLDSFKNKGREKWEAGKKAFLCFAGVAPVSEEREPSSREKRLFSPSEAKALRENPLLISRPKERPAALSFFQKYPFLRLSLSRPWKNNRRKPRDFSKTAQKMEHQEKTRRRKTLILQIIKRHGIRFLLHRYRHRKGLAAGLLLGMIFLFAMQNYVWDIQVRGNQSVSDGAILETLKEFHLDVGTPKDQIKTNILSQQLLLRHPEMAWAAINVMDCKVVVELQERVYPPEEVEKSQPTNVVAKEEGVIVSMQVKGGKAVVKKGDGVAKGDLLITGLFEDSYGRMLIQHGWGQVIAQVKQTVTIQIPLQQTKWIPAGASSTQYSLQILGCKIPLFLPSLRQTAFSKTETKKPLTIGSLELPLTLHQTTVTPLQQETEQLSEKQARELAEAELQKQLSLQFASDEILSTTQVGYVEKDIFYLECTVDCLRDIALEQPFESEAISPEK